MSAIVIRRLFPSVIGVATEARALDVVQSNDSFHFGFSSKSFRCVYYNKSQRACLQNQAPIRQNVKNFPESSSLSSEEFARSIIKIHLILLKNRLTIIAKLFPTETSRNDNACRLQTAFGCSMSQPQMLE